MWDADEARPDGPRGRREFAMKDSQQAVTDLRPLGRASPANGTHARVRGERAARLGVRGSAGRRTGDLERPAVAIRRLTLGVVGRRLRWHTELTPPSDYSPGSTD